MLIGQKIKKVEPWLRVPTLEKKTWEYESTCFP